MIETTKFELVELSFDQYEAMVDLWSRSGLPVRHEGRDSSKAFAVQQAEGHQRVIGIRTAEGTLVALTVLTHDGRKGWINRLAVDPAFRRRGLATHLVAEAERWFMQDVGLEIWAALIEGNNTQSQALFDRLGFQKHDVVYVSKRTRSEA